MDNFKKPHELELRDDQWGWGYREGQLCRVVQPDPCESCGKSYVWDDLNGDWIANCECWEK